MKRIGIIVPWNSQGGGAGAEEQMLLLIKYLQQEDYDFSLVCIGSQTPDISYIQSRIGSQPTVHIIQASRIRFAYNELKNLLVKESYDIVLTNVVPICFITLLISLVSRVPSKIVSVHHGTDFSSIKNYIYSILIVLTSYKTIFVSQGIQERVPFASKKNSLVIYNFFDTKEIARLAQQVPDDRDLIESLNRPRLLYLGRIDQYQKNIRLLLEAFGLFRDQKPGNLVIVGDGPDTEELQKKIHLHKYKKDIHFIGWRDNPYPYVAHCDVLLVTSDFEGFGRVIIDALTLGVPVVSTDCPYGPSEILSDDRCGILVPVDNAKQFAQGIDQQLQRVADSEILEQRARDFDYTASVKQYRELFNSII